MSKGGNLPTIEVNSQKNAKTPTLIPVYQPTILMARSTVDDSRADRLRIVLATVARGGGGSSSRSRFEGMGTAAFLRLPGSSSSRNSIKAGSGRGAGTVARRPRGAGRAAAEAPLNRPGDGKNRTAILAP